MNLDTQAHLQMLLATKPLAGYPNRPYGLSATQFWNNYIGVRTYRGYGDWEKVAEMLMAATEVLNTKTTQENQ